MGEGSLSFSVALGQFLQMWAEQQLPILGASGDSPNLGRSVGAIRIIQEDPERLPDTEPSLRMGLLRVRKEHLSLHQIKPI